MTIIQKLEHYAPLASFVIVLMTADDLGRSKDETNLTARARQNVILKLGYFIGKIERTRVHVAAHWEIEIPSDWLGVLNSRITYDKLDFEKLRQHLKSAGFSLCYYKIANSIETVLASTSDVKNSINHTLLFRMKWNSY